MRQSTPSLPPVSAEDKVKFMEFNAELRDLKSQESLADYERMKGTLPEWEWSELKEKIRIKFNKILEERNEILSSK